ncbi:hypothetical protein MMC21_002098 [Puttea exsequens]|nr:hypothetical protein [Puttea exsequens]
MAGLGLHALTAIPERRSSKGMLRGSSEEPVPLTPLHEPPPVPAHETPQPRITIPSRGHAESPLKRPDEHSPPEKPPAVTFVPSALPNDLLDTPKLFHPRLRLAIHLSTPVFMGGATIEGEIIVLIDGASARKKRKSKDDLSLKRIAVTLVGIERCKSRQEIFHALMCDLIDGSHPPPTNMVPHHGLGATWNVQASESTLPFRLDLPVLMGPPPFRSKEVGIRYNLSTLAEFSIAGKSHFARESRDIVVLTVHDPEKALVNLQDPLLVSDTLYLSKKQGGQRVILVAGLHRQTWISGYTIYLDIHIENKSNRTVKKVELQLERVTLYHHYSAASTGTKSAEMLRIPDHLSKDLVVRRELSDDFVGVRAGAEDFRTCQLQIPTGLVSIETGRFFGIRYFLNVQITCSLNKHLKVQLPITIIHPNSIDIPPNAVAQVAASIEHKHRNDFSTTGSPYRYRAGQAFQCARRQSYLQIRNKDAVPSTEMEELTRALENSPRRMAPQQRIEESPTARRLHNLSDQQQQQQQQHSPSKKSTVTRRLSAVNLGATGLNRSNHVRLRHHPSLSNATYLSMPPSTLGTRNSFDRQSPTRGPRSSLEKNVKRGLRGSFDMPGPRLQRSTSGLAFDDSDKENMPPKDWMG